MVKNNGFFVALCFLWALSIQGCGENPDNLVQPNLPPNLPPNNAVVTGAKITVDNAHFVGTCPHTFKFSGLITARGSGVVTYSWDYTESGPGFGEGSISFDSAGSKTVTGEVTFGSSGLDEVQLRIKSPNQFDSNRLRIEATCQ